MHKYLLALTLCFLVSCSTFRKGGTAASTGQNGEQATEADPEVDKAIKKLPSGNQTGDLNTPGAGAFAMPLEVNEEVETWIEYFRGRGREHFTRYLERSTRYTALMKKILAENGVPEDLIYVAMIESGFTGKIKSRARAVGYWQFISGTGKHYGLRSNKWVDERWDPIRSTEAAAAYFKGLYNLFGNWYLALASYNVGENRIKSLVMKNFTRNFWELAQKKQLPSETMHYIPKFLAARLIAQEPEKYGFVGLDYMEPLNFDTITASDTIDMKKLAKEIGADYDDLRELNPSWKSQYALAYDGKASVRVPVGMGEKAKAVVTDALVKEKRFLAEAGAEPSKDTFLRYRVKRGDSLEKIADEFEVNVDEIIKINRRRKNGVLRPGTTLKIPGNTTLRKSDDRKFASKKSKSKRKLSEVYLVRHGDTLQSIARRFGRSVESIAKENRLVSNRNLYRGRRIVIPD